MALKLASERQVLGELIRLRSQGDMEAIKLTMSLKTIYSLVGTPYLYNPHILHTIENTLDKYLSVMDAPLLLSALETIKLLVRISK